MWVWGVGTSMGDMRDLVFKTNLNKNKNKNEKHTLGLKQCILMHCGQQQVCGGWKPCVWGLKMGVWGLKLCVCVGGGCWDSLAMWLHLPHHCYLWGYKILVVDE